MLKSRTLYNRLRRLLRKIITPIVLLFGRRLLEYRGKIRQRGEIILAFGGHNGDLFEDNSRALAEYCSQDPRFTVVWITQGKKNWEELRSAGIKPLTKGSYKSELYLSQATAAFYSHSFHDLSPHIPPHSRNRIDVYLGHGVWGLKRIERRGFKAQNYGFSFTICASNTEARLKSMVFGMAEDDVIPTGLPKHDTFLKSLPTPDAGPKTVLYAPTWRDWLQHKPSDKATELFLSALERLIAARPKCTTDGGDYRVVFLLHKNIKNLTDAATAICTRLGVELVTGDSRVGKLMRQSDFVITDYSSILWDAMMLDRPCVSFNYDLVIYRELTGYYPEVARHIAQISYDDEVEVWKELFSKQNRSKIRQIREAVMPFSKGVSCQNILAEVMNRVQVGAARTE